ncbi:hypothetical protein BASA81_015181 [Batrachochytrium salamandrivorans]|nr:hypothetical protein BASA81_015181 [Batrachochytrium salamandrivorans]
MENKRTRVSTYEVKAVLNQVPEYHFTFKTVSAYRDLISMINAAAPPPVSPTSQFRPRALGKKKEDEEEEKEEEEKEEDEDAFSAEDVFDLDCQIVTRLKL